MPFADPICSTRSTGRKSTPRSSDEVATTAFRRPSFRPSSTQSRVALSSEPWCSATRPAHSGRSSSSSWYQASACERMLTKTKVVVDRSISSTTGCCICLPRWPPHEKRPGWSGSRVSITSALSRRPRTISPSSPPSSTCIASRRLPSVAERPHTTSPGFQRFSRAIASCTCTPRLLPISSCHSSTITVWIARSSSCACSRVNIRLNDSGVVISAVGKRRSWRARSADGVSPVRAPSVQLAPASSSGACNARRVSAASARIGVIQRTPSGGAPDARSGTPTARLRASAPNQTAYVLPEPVVACSSPLRPADIAAQTSRWNANGSQPRAANQSSCSGSASDRPYSRGSGSPLRARRERS